MSKVLAVLMVGALTGVVALAKGKRVQTTFDSDMKVNGTLVKKGTYDVKFDEETGQLSIVKDGKVVVETATRLEPRTNKARNFQLRAIRNGDELQLAGVTFGGSDKDVMIANNGASTSGNN
jgi:hypothetical protein